MKGYRILSYFKIWSKTLNQTFSRIVSKRAIQKTAGATADLINNRFGNKIQKIYHGYS